MSKIACLFLVFTIGCSTANKKPAVVVTPVAAREFSRGELILGTQLLTKIFDAEMAPISCVPDLDEASLLLRTIRPRMEVVQDDLEAMLDDSTQVTNLIKTCEQSCICGYVDELFREHLVPLSAIQKKMFLKKRSPEEVSRCLNYIRTTFCQGELYKELNKEKVDFSFEEDS